MAIQVTVDVVLVSRDRRAGQVLLVERGHEPFKGSWALPGGFLNEGEELEAGARRELQEETGLSGMMLTQLGAWGKPGRDPRGHTVSIVYWGEVDVTKSVPKAGDDAAKARFWPLTGLPPLAFDHEEILEEARALMDSE